MRKKRIITTALVLTLALTVLQNENTTANAITMSSITSDSIAKKQEQIDQALREKKAVQSSITYLKEIKNKLESQKSEMKKYVAQLDAEMETIEANIEELKGKISDKEQEITVTTQELEEAQEKEEHQKDSMVSRIRMVYESGNPQMTDMLLRAVNFGDMLNRADYVERVYEYDRKVLNEYITIREYVDLCKQQLEIERYILNETKLGVEEQQKALDELINQKKNDILAYEQDIATKDKAIKEYEADLRAQEEEIAALETLIAEEKKKILAASGVVLNYDGGAFCFPVASYTRVSDDYGNRIHPTLHVQQFHNGVDLASPKGTSIYAAYDGVVVAATYSATMGNYVFIDHGSGLYTIYMHASKLCVKKDDIVVRGEKIAEVGSTGRSTGNHLHFSVRKDGNYVSPWNYISRK